MRNWAQYPPKDQGERNEMRRDYLAVLQKRAERHITCECHPDAKLFQTPYLMSRHGTGMQNYEWTLLANHIEKNPVKVAGFWPNIYIIHPDTFVKRVKRDIEPKLLYPWLPRLDAVMLTHTKHLVTMEIVDRLTVHAVGELVLKTQLFEHGFPHAFPVHHMQLIYLQDNEILKTMLIDRLSPPVMSRVRLFQYPASEIRIGAEGEPDYVKFVRLLEEQEAKK